MQAMLYVIYKTWRIQFKAKSREDAIAVLFHPTHSFRNKSSLRTLLIQFIVLHPSIVVVVVISFKAISHAYS